MDTTARPVVVGVDLSDTSDHALAWAATEAVRLGRPLTVLHAYEPGAYPAVRAGVPGGTVVADLDETLKDVAHHTATHCADRVRQSHPGLEVRTLNPVGPAGATLVEASRAAELVVVGARGQGTLKGILFGSVSTHVCAHSHAPVIVVREATSRSPDDACVVVGVDGSETSQAALAFAYAQASSRGLGLTIAHTWQFDGDEPSVAWGIDVEQLGEQERSVVAEAVAGFGEQYPDVDVRRHVTQGDPVEELGQLSENACLLVVGTHGRGTVSGWLKGSVSQPLLRAAHCPVAVVHPFGDSQTRTVEGRGART